MSSRSVFLPLSLSCSQLFLCCQPIMSAVLPVLRQATGKQATSVPVCVAGAGSVIQEGRQRESCELHGAQGARCVWDRWGVGRQAHIVAEPAAKTSRGRRAAQPTVPPSDAGVEDTDKAGHAGRKRTEGCASVCTFCACCQHGASCHMCDPLSAEWMRLAPVSLVHIRRTRSKSMLQLAIC